MNVTIAPSFVPNPPGRGTLGLVWECLFTNFLCLWTVVHPAVVPPSVERDWLFKSSSKFAWCCMIFFLPERAILQVVLEYLTVRELCHSANRDIREPVLTIGLSEDEIPLTTSPETGHNSSCPVSQKIVGPGQKWGLAHGYLVQMER